MPEIEVPATVFKAVPPVGFVYQKYDPPPAVVISVNTPLPETDEQSVEGPP